MERNWPRSGSGGSGSGSNCAAASSGSLVVLRVNNGMLHTVMLPTSDGSDLAVGYALQKNRKKMIMGADTLLGCKPFVVSARLGLGPCKPSQRLPTLRR